MKARRLIELVEENDGNLFALASAIAAEQKESDALLAEQAGALEIATQIRTSE